MIKETVTMSHKELDRLHIIQESLNRHITQEQAAARIGISIRQVKRLVQRYRNEGPSGLVSRRRGKRPNNSFSTEFRATVISLLKGRYADFGPTLACEKLREIHGLCLSIETLRKWMVEEGIWRERRRKFARIYQRRMRRPSYGELIQIDGSPHDWFEGRGPKCTLIVFIDDATSALMALRFAPAETTRAYMETLRGYLNDHGVPLALYSDRHSIFRVNNPEREGELTQFTRAIKTLGIEPIHANSPQAKGRVERANQTLQDRLVKEMRLQGIVTEAASEHKLIRDQEETTRQTEKDMLNKAVKAEKEKSETQERIVVPVEDAVRITPGMLEVDDRNEPTIPAGKVLIQVASSDSVSHDEIGRHIRAEKEPLASKVASERAGVSRIVNELANTERDIIRQPENSERGRMPEREEQTLTRTIQKER